MTLNHERFSWIVFDAADTLLHPEPGVAVVYHQIAQQHGVNIPIESIRNRFQPALRKHFAEESSNEELDRGRWKALVFEILETQDARVFDELWNHFAEPKHWRLFEDVGPAWNWLTGRGFQLAIASNFDARLKNVVAALPPISRTAHVFISSELGFRKPSAKFFRQIESELDTPAEELLMIGDSKLNDFESAKQAGWQSLHLDRACIRPSLPTIRSLEELTKLFSW